MTKEIASSMANAWNKHNNIGCNVYLTNDNGSTERTKTTSEAWVLGGHTPVVKVESKPGAYLLTRIQAIPA